MSLDSVRYCFEDISIIVKHSKRAMWNKVIDFELGRQLSGFESNHRYETAIVFRDIEEIKSEGKSVRSILVPDAYRYSSGSENDYEEFHIVNRNTIIQFSDKKLVVYSDCSVPYSIPFLLQFLLIRQGRFFVHSSAVAMEGRATVFCAFGGVGKTAILAEALKKEGYKILGDDVNIINRNGAVAPFYRPFCIYPYHVALFDRLDRVKIHKATIPRRAYRKALRYIGVLQKIEFNYHTITVEKLAKNENLLDSSVPIQRIIIANRVAGIVGIQIEPTDVNDAVQYCMNVMLNEWHSYLRDLIVLLLMDGKGLEGYLKEIEDVLREAFAEKEIIRMDIPESESLESVKNAFFSIVEGNA